MNIIYVTYVPTNFQQEFELIEKLCKYEGYQVAVIYPHDKDYATYYKGSHPAILIYEELDNAPTVLYGFWQLIMFMLNTDTLKKHK